PLSSNSQNHRLRRPAAKGGFATANSVTATAARRRPNHLRGAQREPISTLALTGRYRSGQTGQTVNLLALRLRWFESSPAQFSADRLRRILMASSLATFAAAVAPAPAIASAAITAPSAAGRPCLSRTGFVDGQRSTFNGLTVEFGNSVLRVLL